MILRSAIIYILITSFIVLTEVKDGLSTVWSWFRILSDPVVGNLFECKLVADTIYFNCITFECGISQKSTICDFCLSTDSNIGIPWHMSHCTSQHDIIYASTTHYVVGGRSLPRFPLFIL